MIHNSIEDLLAINTTLNKYISHDSMTIANSLTSMSAGHLCMAGYGLGTVSSVNPLADTLQLSTRLLLEELWLCDDVGCVANSSNYIYDLESF